MRLHFEQLEKRELLRAGVLDPSFGENGIVEHGSYIEDGSRIFVETSTHDRNGNLLLATQYDGSHRIFRLMSNGDFDRSFGNKGYVDLTPEGSLSEQLSISDLLVDPNSDSIFVVGTSKHSWIAKLNHDGSVDPFFGKSGTVFLDAVGTKVYSAEMGHEGNARIVVRHSGTLFRSFVIDSQGNLESVVDLPRTSTPSGVQPTLRDIATDDAHWALYDMHDSLLVLVSTFVGDISGFDEFGPGGSSRVLTPDGREVTGMIDAFIERVETGILVAVNRWQSDDFVVKLDNSGAVDMTFGENGYVNLGELSILEFGETTSQGFYAFSRDQDSVVVYDADGAVKYLASQENLFSTVVAVSDEFGIDMIGREWGAFRLYHWDSMGQQVGNSDGQLVELPMSYRYLETHDSAIDSKGNIWALTRHPATRYLMLSSFSPAGERRSEFTFYRPQLSQSRLFIWNESPVVVEAAYGSLGITFFDSNGTIDESRGELGRMSLPFANVHGIDVIEGSDGGFLVVGSITLDFSEMLPERHLLLRFDAAGNIVQPKGVAVGFSTFGEYDRPVSQICSNGDSNAWTLVRFGGAYFLVRVDEDLQIVPFANAPSISLGDFGDSGNAEIHCGTDGIYLASPTSAHIGVWRYDYEGNLDVTFGQAGMAVIHSAASIEQVRDIDVDSQGRIFVSGIGWTLDDRSYSINMARLQRNGQLETTFGCNGIVNVRTGGTVDAIDRLHIDANGDIVFSGWNRHGVDRTAMIGRILSNSSNGILDWQNPCNALDVNNDGVVAPIDALAVINQLNSGQSGPLPINGPIGDDDLTDVNGDGQVTPIDALSVINWLNQNSTVQAAAALSETDGLSAELQGGRANEFEPPNRSAIVVQTQGDNDVNVFVLSGNFRVKRALLAAAVDSVLGDLDERNDFDSMRLDRSDFFRIKRPTAASEP